MSVTGYKVVPVQIQDIRDFIEEHHYSGNVNGLRVGHCFALYDDNRPFGQQMIGAMIYGALGMASAWKKYGDKENDVIELRRLCCIDDTPKNTESFFIGQTLQWLKTNTDIKVIVSYADAHYGHGGIIYKATNFFHEGMTSKSRVIMLNGRQYHDKTIRTYYTNKDGIRNLKPFAQRVKDALDREEAYYEDRPPKHIYLFFLDKKIRKKYIKSKISLTKGVC
jgi:hypothetical protein